jgi:ABC-2 type transport system permease protein
MTDALARLHRPSALNLGGYAALAGMETKKFLVYQWSVVLELIQNLIGTVVFVYFWRALYAQTSAIAGLTLDTTLAYVLLARIFQPLGAFMLVSEFGHQMRQGGIAHIQLRPVDIQLAYYVQNLATTLVSLARQLPVALVALLVFHLRWPADPAVWAVFILSALLGRSVLFCFDYILGSVAFYTTSAWGLGFAVFGLSLFVGGGLVPLVMLPDWLRVIVLNTPFAQAFYVPISLLSGVAPLSDAPRLLLTQLLWLLGLAPLARLVFAVAIRRVTVQGG